MTELKTPDFFAQLHSLEWKDWDKSTDENSWRVLENQHHILTSCIGDVLSVNASRTKLLLTSTERVRITNFSWSNWKDCRDDRNFTQKLSRGHTTRKVKRKSAWKYFVSLRFKKIKKDRVVVQSLNYMFDRPEHQERSTRDDWIIIQIVFADCLENLYLTRIGRLDIL